MRITVYQDLMAQYEKPLSHACDLYQGQVFIANGWEKPEGLCQSAWDTLSPFVLALSHGAENFYEGWMKIPDLPCFPATTGSGRSVFWWKLWTKMQNKENSYV